MPPTNPMIELMLTIDPPPIFAICSAASLVPRKTLVWLTAMIRCQPSTPSGCRPSSPKSRHCSPGCRAGRKSSASWQSGRTIRLRWSRRFWLRSPRPRRRGSQRQPAPRVIAQDVGDDDLRTLSREQPGSPQFVGLLAGVVLIMGGLAYFPAVSLGPVTEQVAMNRGTHFLYPSACP